MLGYEWLSKNDATVDIGRGCIHVGGNQRTTCYFTYRDRSVSDNPVNAENDFPEEYAPRFASTIEQFADVFDVTNVTGVSRTVKHTIRLTTDTPFRIRPYSYNDKKTHYSGRSAKDAREWST